jgi:hypothetical protein
MAKNPGSSFNNALVELQVSFLRKSFNYFLPFFIEVIIGKQSTTEKAISLGITP